MDFSEPAIARTGAAALPTNAWAADISLAPGTTYYWKARALNAGTSSAWSATGIFTTVAPAETIPAATPSPSSTAPPQPTPSLQGFSPTTSPPATPAVTLSPAITVAPPPVTVLYEPGAVPPWFVYTIGGVLVSVVLMLAVLFVVVLKIRRR